MAFGTPLSLTLPTVSSTVGPTYATQVNAAIQTVADQFSTKLTPASLNINATLDINSQIVENIDQLEFDDHGAALTTARTIYFENDDAYIVDGSNNSVRITASGALNISATGAFGGDYTSSDAIATFTTATTLYKFLSDDSPSELYAGVNVGDIRLHEKGNFTNYVAFVSPASLATSYTVKLPAAVPASKSVVQMDTNGDLDVSAVVDASDALTFTNFDSLKYAGGKQITGNIANFLTVAGSPSLSTDGGILTMAVGDSVLLPLDGFDAAEKVNGVALVYNGNATGTATLELFRRDVSVTSSTSFVFDSTENTLSISSLASDVLTTGSYVVKVTLAGGANTFNILGVQVSLQKD